MPALFSATSAGTRSPTILGVMSTEAGRPRRGSGAQASVSPSTSPACDVGELTAPREAACSELPAPLSDHLAGGPPRPPAPPSSGASGEDRHGDGESRRAGSAPRAGGRRLRHGSTCRARAPLLTYRSVAARGTPAGQAVARVTGLLFEVAGSRADADVRLSLRLPLGAVRKLLRAGTILAPGGSMLLRSLDRTGRGRRRRDTMFARVTYVQAPEGEGKIQEGLKLWYQNVLPTTSAREGFKGVLSLVDHETGKGALGHALGGRRGAAREHRGRVPQAGARAVRRVLPRASTTPRTTR